MRHWCCVERVVESGALDAVAVTSPRRGFTAGSPLFRRWFPDARAVGAEYYRETKIFSDHALVVVRRAVYSKHPLVAMTLALWRFKGPKQKAYESLEERLAPCPGSTWILNMLSR